ncbi:LysR family transcriptional regulator [Nakamurella sp. PAMC28650]|uniref:LysR family transcriptional regulator n=1 Tax=Nakamurella sp. PAMC28650 TaxID=2762325 RepID=UPI00164E5C6F|nr:LysR family transcriptional regulator [Nakamurella sp. PAMC28650]QNK80199.1 LysR family transcriptional regulator [Nakamurella sp. PAMC28650]
MASADDLLVLLEVARSGTFAAAGAALGIEHTTVSRRITALERDLGSPVVVRTARGCALTEFGRALLDGAERIERTMVAVGELSGAPGHPGAALTGLVRIAAPEAFGACFVAPVMARVHRRHPAVTLELVTATRPLVQGVGADLEIGVGGPASSRVEAFTLATYTLGLYASDDYLRLRGRPRERAELVGHSLVYYIDSLLRVTDLDLIGELFPGGSVQIGSTSVHSQIQVAQAGGGIGILPNFLAGRTAGLTRLLPAEVDVPLTFTAVLAPRVLRRPAAAEVLRELREEVDRRSAELRPA